MIKFTAYNEQPIYINPKHIVSAHTIYIEDEDKKSADYVRVKTVDGTEYDLDTDIGWFSGALEEAGVKVHDE